MINSVSVKKYIYNMTKFSFSTKFLDVMYTSIQIVFDIQLLTQYTNTTHSLPK